MPRPKGRLLVWSWCDPSFPSGSPAILSDLVSHFRPGDVEIWCEDQRTGSPARRVALAHPVHRASRHQLWTLRRGDRVRHALRFVSAAVLTAIGIRRVRVFRPDAILTVFRDERWILSSYLISRATGVPVIYYVHDPYREAAEHGGGASAVLARWLEPAALGHGRLVVLGEGLRTLYQRRYGLESTIVRHLVDRARPTPRRRPSAGAARLIGFSGTIYANNVGLMKQLSEAAAAVGARVRLLTNAKREVLAARGIAGDHLEIRFEPDQARMTELLGECDLLYLPLEFHDSLSLPTDSLRYAFPTKVRDYLLAGPEVLAHCPADYDTAEFLVGRRAAHHLGDDGPGALREWLRRWTAGELEAISEEAMARALEEFEPTKNIDRFAQVMGRPGRT